MPDTTTDQEHAQRRDRAQALATTPVVPEGERNDAILSVMFLRAEDGWTNHEILTEAEELGMRWGKYTRTNLYHDWYSLLSMLKRVRRKYPSPGRETGDA